ncbi:hypothetical protein [Neptuniibacter sp. 2_MG-2023]|uniref:hypothetical protein n=1 Tax=Neptuniibacter sp. 2_MG-2023 TaxID=3062671 RepID=UPI0026E1A192|nr:hypothetical protein [Neptuniibacter sp. 2_MG-2023]MDO6514637.1 hypothetical protein [Neptuniibacter sp. 2_MG-2023]
MHNTLASFNAQAHIPIDEPLKKHLPATKSAISIQQMDQFYLTMLEQFSPVTQKKYYLAQQEKQIQALFRVDGILVAAFYTDSTILCFDQKVESLIEAINYAPLSLDRVSFILESRLSDHVTLEYYSKNYPTHGDLLKGSLYTKADLKAGFTIDETSLEELMCDWLQQYQQWMQDYLYFNLAQISAEESEIPKTITNDPAPVEEDIVTTLLANNYAIVS